MDMDFGICVKIPERCFLSPNPEENFPSPFSFTVTYGKIPKDRQRLTALGRKEAIKYPQITISGLEKLIPDTAKQEDFVKNLKLSGDTDWAIKKSALSSDIIIKYTGIELSPDFFFSASTDSLVIGTKNNDVVTMLVKVENFEGIEDYQYVVSTKVDYVPWAESVTFSKNPVALKETVEVHYEYVGDHVDKLLMQNGEIVDTARSPYTAVIDRPTEFTLLVFNDCGMKSPAQNYIDVLPPEITSFTADRDYFSKGDKVTLKWELKSVSNISIDNINEETDKVRETDADVYPQGSQDATYTLRANGYDKNSNPTSVPKSITLFYTQWKNVGNTTGYFSGDVYGNIEYSKRIFQYQGKYYCYAHPTLYKSEDGKKWEEAGKNDVAASQFKCIASDCFNGTVYIMGREGENGDRLYISKYDFSKGSWSYGPAYQNCHSNQGSFAFSDTSKAFTQVMENGLMIVRSGADERWNHETSVIVSPTPKKVIGGDYCFYKNTFYAVMLSEDGYAYVYDCDKSMQEVLYKKPVSQEDRFINLIPTVNALYAVTASSLLDAKKGETVDKYSIMKGVKEQRMWMGVSKEDELMGIYPDKCLWQLNS